MAITVVVLMILMDIFTMHHTFPSTMKHVTHGSHGHFSAGPPGLGSRFCARGSPSPSLPPVPWRIGAWSPTERRRDGPGPRRWGGDGGKIHKIPMVSYGCTGYSYTIAML